MFRVPVLQQMAESSGLLDVYCHHVPHQLALLPGHLRHLHSPLPRRHVQESK